MNKRKSLIRQLFPSYLAIVLMALVAVGWLVLSIFKTYAYDQTALGLEARIRLISTQVDTLVGKNQRNQLTHLVHTLGLASHTRFTIIDGGGRVLADSDHEAGGMDNHGWRPEIAAARATGKGMDWRQSATLQKPMLYVAVKQEGLKPYFIRAAVPLTPINQTISQTYRQLLPWALVIVLVAAVFSWLMAARITRPLEAMKAVAQRFAAGDFSASYPVPDTEEMGKLAESLNHMAAQLEERLRTMSRQQQEQQAVLGAMKEGVIAVDKNLKLLEINDSALALFQLDREKTKEKTFQECVRKPDLYQFLLQVLEEGRPLEGEVVFYEKGERIMHTSGAPLKDESGQINGALLVLNDMTEQKHLEKIRREFVANVSHELKTPITLIQGFVETLLDGAINQRHDAMRFLKKILDNSMRLHSIVENLLNLSRIEQAEAGDLPMETVALRNLLDTSMTQCLPTAKSRKMTLGLECDPDIMLTANSHLIEQAVINLVDNAVKYSQSVQPITLAGREDRQGIIIEVRDFGVGIKDEDLPRLFERFYRIDKSRSRHVGGTGLGLAIVKHIVQAHRGTVEVSSRINQGTIFTLHLPR